MDLGFWLVLIFASILGAGIGSFLNVVILRGQRGETLKGRSYCDSCKTILTPRDLIPILSFIIQKGRCRSCGAVLFWQYPLVELLTGISFGVATWLVGIEKFFHLWNILPLILVYIAISAAIVIFVNDLKYYLIPSGAVSVLVGVGIIMTALRSWSGLFFTPKVLFFDFIGAFLSSLMLFTMWLFSRGRWMGFGDVRLIFATSLVVGFPYSLIALIFSFWTGAAGALFLLVSGLKGFKDHMPFGPYILIGTVLAYFFADIFIQSIGLDELSRLFF